MSTRGALVAFLICAASMPSSAQQGPCGPTGAVEKRIHDQYGETIVGAGMVAGGILFTLANPDTGTFTVLIRRPDKMTCIVMSGTGWASVEPQKPGTNL
jgi:hypothetical protein